MLLWQLLSLTCIQFEMRFEYLIKTTEFWVYATTYKGLSCYFMKQRYLASQRTLIQSVLFLITISIPLLYIVCEGKNIDNVGVPVRGWESKVREPKRRLSLIKWNIILMWLNILSLQWSVKQIWWNSEHSMYIMMHCWTWKWWFFLTTFCYKLTPKNTCLSRIHR